MTSNPGTPCPPGAKAFEGTYLGLNYCGFEGAVEGVPYVIYLPEGWRPGGPLIMNMYGYVPAADVPTAGLFPGPGDLPLKAIYDRRARPWLALGYAVAVSRSTQGWFPRQRMTDTEKLRQYFIRQIGRGRPSYPSVISGFSMGGMQTYRVIESPDTPYDGALALCGFGIRSLTYLQEYVFNTRLLFDAAFPGELSGSVVTFPDGKNTMKNACERLREAIPDGPDEPVAALMCLPRLGRAPSRLLDPTKIEPYLKATSIVRIGQIPAKVALDSELLRELFERSGGKNIFDVPPYKAEAQFHEEVEITGSINKPVVAMHTTKDEFVPFILAEEYAKRVDGQGKLDNLVQLKTIRSGHCNFNDAELGGALRLLDIWIREGVRPSGGYFTDGLS